MTSSQPSPDNRPPSATSLRHLRPAVVAMSGYAPGEQVNDCIKLNTNECPWGPSPTVLEVLRLVGEDALRLYPDPLSRKLREACAERYQVTVDEVLAGNGSDDCLTMVYRAFLAPGERVATPWPTYGLYDTLASLQGAACEHCDYLPEWQLPRNLARLGAKLIIVANPNNPSATLTPVAELRRLADEHDGILVIDEAYVDFALGAGMQASMLPHLKEHANLIVLRSFSKSYSMAGARLGLLFAHPDLVSQLAKVKDSYNVNALTQALGRAAVNDRAYHRGLVARTLAERTRLESGLERFGWSWPDSAANFILVEVGARAGELYRALKARGVLVRWWDRPELATKLRITVGKPEHSDRLVSLLTELV
jgi:histidinol-phosphate aminotransferase